MSSPRLPRQSNLSPAWAKAVGLMIALMASAPPGANALLPTAKPNARAAPALPSKSEIVARLRGMQVKLTSEIAALENSTKKRLVESTSISLKQDLNVASQKITRLAEQIEDIERKRIELLTRRDFLNQLTLLVDSKWDGQNLQKFLEHTLLDMATTDLTSPDGASSTWRMATYLSIAVREIPQGRDDVLGVMESYMSATSILQPKTPADFAGRRDYTNDVSAATARPVPRDQVGDGIDEKLRQLQLKDSSLGISRPLGASPSSAAKADVELRLKQPTPPLPSPTPGSGAGLRSEPGPGKETRRDTESGRGTGSASQPEPEPEPQAPRAPKILPPNS